MKKGLLILLTVITTNGFTQDNSYNPKNSTTLDSSKGEQLLRQCSRGTPKNISEYWTPTEADIASLEKQFMKVKKIKATACCLINGTIQTLDNFTFQYIGVTIKKKKYIYLNAFRLDNDDDFKTFFKNWKTDPIVMCDGGDYYWGVLFDLDKLKFRDLAINGV
jgi:hypothetical protein